MTQVSKTGPWFSPRPVGSGFGEPTHLEEKLKADKAQERPDGYQPKAGEGGAGVRTDLCPPITWTPRKHWREVKMSHDSLTNFASCQSSLGPLSVSQGTFTPSNLKLPQLTPSLPAPKGYGGS